jgi:hypothetical protein
LLYQELESIGVGQETGRGHATDARSDGTSLAATLLEAAYPGSADAILLGDRLVAEPSVAIRQHALA